jgi:hypothetical protein
MYVHVVHDSTHESIIHVVGRVEDQIVQHILSQIPDNLCIYVLHFLKILKNARRCSALDG